VCASGLTCSGGACVCSAGGCGSCPLLQFPCCKNTTTCGCQIPVVGPCQ
jgi:hypothetical protein